MQNELPRWVRFNSVCLNNDQHHKNISILVSRLEMDDEEESRVAMHYCVNISTLINAYSAQFCSLQAEVSLSPDFHLKAHREDVYGDGRIEASTYNLLLLIA